MNCNNCGVVIKQAEKECWSCGKVVDPSLQSRVQEPPEAPFAPSQPMPQVPEGNIVFSPASGMRSMSHVPMPRDGKSGAPTIDPVKQRKLQKKIRNACIAAILSGLVTFGAVAAGVIESYAAVDALLIFALAYGIYKRNLTCAIALIVYFAASKAYLFLTVPETLSGGSMAVSGLVLVYLIDGAIAIKKLRRFRASL